MVQVHELNPIDHMACPGVGFMAEQVSSSQGSGELDVLGAPVDSHRTMLFEPVHTENGIVRAQWKDLHVGVEIVALRRPLARGNRSSAGEFAPSSNTDTARLLERHGARHLLGELLVDEGYRAAAVNEE